MLMLWSSNWIHILIEFIHILQGCFTGAEVMLRLPPHQWCQSEWHGQPSFSWQICTGTHTHTHIYIYIYIYSHNWRTFCLTGVGLEPRIATECTKTYKTANHAKNWDLLYTGPDLGMMTTSNENTFHSHRWIPRTMASDAEFESGPKIAWRQEATDHYFSQSSDGYLTITYMTSLRMCLFTETPKSDELLLKEAPKVLTISILKYISTANVRRKCNNKLSRSIHFKVQSQISLGANPRWWPYRKLLRSALGVRFNVILSGESNKSKYLRNSVIIGFLFNVNGERRSTTALHDMRGNVSAVVDRLLELCFLFTQSPINCIGMASNQTKQKYDL